MAAVKAKTGKLVKAKDGKHPTGWVSNPRWTEEVVAGLPHPVFALAAADLKDSGKGKVVLLSEAAKKVLGKHLLPHEQTVGDCVSHSYGSAIDYLIMVRIASGLAEEFKAETVTELIYAGSRVEVGGGRLGNGDGSLGAWAAKAVSELGTLVRGKHGSHDFSRYDGQVAKRLGAPGKGVPDELEPALREHIVRTFSLITNYESARDAIANGYPVSVCSMQGFNDTRDKDGFLKPEGEWAHAMLFVGVDDQFARPGLMCLNSWGCYDDQTEVLTDQGWKLFADLDGSELTATLNQSNGALEYQRPVARHCYPFDGHLFHFGGRDLDLTVTPNHNMYVGFPPFHARPRRWRLVRADEMPAHVLIKKDAEWSGDEVQFHECGDAIIPMDAWLEFLGYWISEGWTYYRESKRRARVVAGGKRRLADDGRMVRHFQYCTGIAQSKPDGVAKIGNLLDSFPFHFTRTKAGWVANIKSLYYELAGFGKAHEKRLPEYVWGLSRRQQRILFDALMVGDGSISMGPTGEKVTFFTSSKVLADDFQRLALHVGYAADISFADRVGRVNSGGVTRYVEYRVGVKRKEVEQRVGGGLRPILVPYRGNVHCVTVPNGVVYVRRNGRAVWCGNSKWVAGPTRHDMPPGSFWVDAETCTRMLRGQDSFAISDFVGYPARKFKYRLY